jgi:nitroreductase
MKELNNILTRTSFSKLKIPYPSNEQMDLIYKAALRAPDHKWLRPSRFIQITGSGLDKLSEIFYNYGKNNIDGISEEKLNKYKSLPYRSPMIVILVSNITDHPSVPEHEQMFTTAAAAQNILLALHALNFGGIWRTGIFAMNIDIEKSLGLSSNQKILGYLYIGTPDGKSKKIPNLNIKEFVTKIDK